MKSRKQRRLTNRIVKGEMWVKAEDGEKKEFKGEYAAWLPANGTASVAANGRAEQRGASRL